MDVSLPLDVLTCIIRDHLADKGTLCSFSLVSRSLSEAAQRVLFFRTTLDYTTILTIEGINMTGSDLPPFEWPKLEFLAQSEKILRYIRVLSVSIDLRDGCPLEVFDEYWHQAEGRSVLNAIDRLLPSALARMSSLYMFRYTGPPLRGPMHQAILCHPSLEALEIPIKTLCTTPCEHVTQRQKSPKIKYLDFSDLGNEIDSFGHCLSDSYAGAPRRCAFLSQMVLTHSTSLAFLRVAMRLLYDALRPSCALPDFPNLCSLLIEDSLEPVKMARRLAMSQVVVPFILHVHEKITALQWGLVMVEETTKQITAGHLPKLETFSGYHIRHLVRTHSFKRLKLISLAENDIDKKTGYSLLRETSSCLPDLTVLSFAPYTRMKVFLYDFCAFTNLTELWYDEMSGCQVGDQESRDKRLYALELVRIVVPALPKLRSLCITVHMKESEMWLRTEDFCKLRRLATRSLLILTFQRIGLQEHCIRHDVYRRNPKGRWRLRRFEGRQWTRMFRLGSTRDIPFEE